MKDWYEAHEQWFWWAFLLSLGFLVIAAIVGPIVVARMSPDYFLPDRDESHSLAKRHPVIRWIGLILKNTLGYFLFLAGLVMVFLPGQGLLTMLIGMVLMDFPGKREFEQRLVRRPVVNRTLNWIRRKAKQPPLLLPE